MRITRAALLVVVGALAIVAPAAPLASAAPIRSSAPATGGTLSYQLYERPSGIDPVSAVDPQEDVVVGALFEGLTSWDAQTSAVLPAAASSWDADAGVKVWTFHLRADARFSNGSRVTAQDFQFAWERLLTGAGKGWGSFLLGNVKGTAALAAGRARHLSGVVARNATTLVVTLTAPFADFPSTVASPSLGPVPRGLLSTPKKAALFRSAPVGNGPFMLAAPWDRKGTISLVPSPGYCGTAPHIAGIRFTVISDLAAAYAQFKAGTLDVCTFPAASLADAEASYGASVDGFTAEPGHQVVSGPIAGVMWSVFNTKRAPLDDVRVRRAFSLALDRTKIAATLPAPAPYVLVTAATDALSPGVPGYMPGRWLYATSDLAQAATLLTAAGYPGGAGLPQITFLTTDKSSKAEYVTDLAALGVKLKLVEVSPAQFWPKWESGKFMMCQDGWTYYPTAAGVLYDLFYGPLNGSGSFYDDTAVNVALRQACATTDDAARLAAFRSIDATVAAAAPVAPITYFSRTVVCSARLHDAVLSQMDLFDFSRVSIE
jgi:peptide/nickel transport system substrate-binding protein/oligopeptide transport system substrate-binding protein